LCFFREHFLKLEVFAPKTVIIMPSYAVDAAVKRTVNKSNFDHTHEFAACCKCKKTARRANGFKAKFEAQDSRMNPKCYF
jgi:hypothetical protein